MRKQATGVRLLAGLMLAGLLNSPASGQQKYWRVGVAYQTGTTFSQFSKSSTARNQDVGFVVEPTRTILLTAEGNINNWLRINAGIGQSRQNYRLNQTVFFPLSIGGWIPAAGGSIIYNPPESQMVGLVGFTVSSKPYGPFTLTAGLDVMARHNPDANVASFGQNVYNRAGFLTEAAQFKDPTTLVEGVDIIYYRTTEDIRRNAAAPVTMALTPRVGVEGQVLDRVSLSIAAIATLGLGKIVDGQGDLNFNGDRVQTRFSHSGSFWGVQVGAKYHLWRGRARKGLHF